MSIDSTLRQLGGFLDEWTRDAASIRSVTVSEGGDAGAEGVTAEVELELPVAGEDRVTPAVTADGGLALTIETPLSVPDAGADAEVDPVEARLHGDGTATVTARLSVSDAGDAEGAAGSYTRERPPEVSAESGTQPREVPPFRNPELLQEVYETHDTFAEMAEALDIDVTGETVRRYMIDHDIHQPNSYRSEPDIEEETTEEMAVRLDGIGLPEGVTAEDLVEAVSRANTIYEVKEILDIDRMEAHNMLKELDMVDLVLGRLSNETSRDITREDVIERLNDASQARAH